MIEANGVELCTESFGYRGTPPILLLAGLAGSMLWWDETFCRALADGGRFVLRYDQRDTGRSVTYPHGQPGYADADLVDDAAAVLDAYGVLAAHVVGVSAGGGLAQLVALDAPARVRSLVLISTSLATAGGREKLPGPSEALLAFFGTAAPDASDTGSVVEYLVDYLRVLAGGERAFDEVYARDLVTRDVARARDHAAARNHESLRDADRQRGPVSSIAAPTLVIHGTADPMFPLAHGEALAREIPGATLLALDGAGHGVERADWDAIVRAILAHTDEHAHRDAP